MIRRGLHALGLGLFALTACAGVRRLEPGGLDLVVNAWTTGDQRTPTVAADAEGTFVVTWSGEGEAGRDASVGIFARRLDRRGNPLGDDFQVNTRASYPGTPRIAATGPGRFVVTWTAYADQDGADRGIFGQRMGESGLRFAPEFQVNTWTTGAQLEPAVAADPAGRFVVTWSDASRDGSGYGVFGRRFDAAGMPIGFEFPVNAWTTGDQRAPAVAATADGFVVAWTGPGATDADGGVFGRRWDAEGRPVGAAFQINTFTTGAQGPPAIAADPAGRFIVVWTSEGQDGSGAGIFARCFDRAATPAGEEFQVNTYTPGDQILPQAASSDDGTILVTWSDDTISGPEQDGSGSGIFAQAYDAAGRRLGGELRVNAWTTGHQWRAAVAGDADGTFVVTWTDGTGLLDGRDGSGPGIAARQLVPAR